MKYTYSNYSVLIGSDTFGESVYLRMWCLPRPKSPPILFMEDVVDHIFFIQQTVVEYQSR